MKTFIYFKQEEFEKATPKCSLSDMNERFMLKLDDARLISGVPYKINSAYRTVEYEKLKGRNGKSSHTKGLAVDIRCINSNERYNIILGLLEAGFNRIGIGKDFIHVDDDQTKPNNVIWVYNN